MSRQTTKSSERVTVLGWCRKCSGDCAGLAEDGKHSIERAKTVSIVAAPHVTLMLEASWNRRWCHVEWVCGETRQKEACRLRGNPVGAAKVVSRGRISVGQGNCW